MQILLITIVSFLLGVLHFENRRLLPKNDIRQFKEPYKEVFLKVKVSSAIEKHNSYHRKKSFCLGRVIYLTERDSWLPVAGRVMVYIFGGGSNLEYGDIFICKGKLINLPQKVPVLFIKSNETKLIKRSRHFLRYIFRLRKRLNENINRLLPYPHQAILSALILGERRFIPKEIKEGFMRTGTVHILAISGLHVGLIVYIVYLMLKILRIPMRFSYLSLVFFIFIYAILTGARAPVIRASIMMGIYLIGLILRKQSSVLNNLALACWLILLFNPEELFNIGFQLSFLIVFSILITLYLSEEWFKREDLEIKRIFLKGLLVSLSAWIGSLGLIAYYFKMINPIAIPANLLIIPLSFFILATGVSVILLPVPLVYPFANTNFLFIEILIKTVKLLNKFSWASISLRKFSFAMALGYYSLLGIITLIFILTISKNRVIYKMKGDEVRDKEMRDG